MIYQRQEIARSRPPVDDTTHPAECLDALHRESLEQMAIQTVALTKSQFLEVLARGEGHFLDFKSRETSAAKLTKILSAFANADGGELYLGIADGGHLTIVGRASKIRRLQTATSKRLSNFFRLALISDTSFCRVMVTQGYSSMSKY